MNKEYNFSLGELTYAIRKINKLTQVEYAKILEVSQSTISKIEKDFFDEVPFSLISKASLKFNVPITYFQMGYLPLRKTKSINKVIPQVYTQGGIFRASTVFHVMNSLQQQGLPNIFKDLKLAYPYLSLSGVTYSFEFIDKLYEYAQDKLLAVLDQGIEQKNQTPKLSLIDYLNEISGISINNQESENSVLIAFDSQVHSNYNVYAKMLAYELMSVYGPRYIIEPTDQSNKYRISWTS